MSSELLSRLFSVLRSFFFRLAISLTLVSIITTIIYIGYPSMMIRPFARGSLKPDSITAKMVKKIEKLDKPNNVFPSNHVAYSLVVTLYLASVAPQLAIIFWVVFGLIAASTVLIKQHEIIDVPAGALLAVFVWYLTSYFI